MNPWGVHERYLFEREDWVKWWKRWPVRAVRAMQLIRDDPTVDNRYLREELKGELMYGKGA